MLSKYQILDNVWPYSYEGNPNLVETYVSYLRRKLDALGPPLIVTVRQIGYTLARAEGVRRVSLRARLTLILIFLATVGLVASDIVSYTSLRTFLIDRADTSLDTAVNSLTSTLEAAKTPHDARRDPDLRGRRRSRATAPRPAA